MAVRHGRFMIVLWYGPQRRPSSSRYRPLRWPGYADTGRGGGAGGRRHRAERAAGAALRQPQGGSRQCARRTGQGSRRLLDLYPRRLAGRNHRRVRELAAHPRLRRVGGLGLSLAAVGQAHGGGATEIEDRSGAAACQARRRKRGDWPACSPECSDRSSIAPAAGAGSPATASTAGSNSSGCGASIRTRRSSNTFLVMRGLDPRIHAASNRSTTLKQKRRRIRCRGSMDCRVKPGNDDGNTSPACAAAAPPRRCARSRNPPAASAPCRPPPRTRECR